MYIIYYDLNGRGFGRATRELVPTWVFRQAFGVVKIHIRWNIKKGWLKS